MVTHHKSSPPSPHRFKLLIFGGEKPDVMRPLLFLVSIALFSLAAGCLVMENAYTKIPPGPWRGVLRLNPRPTLGADPDEVVKQLKQGEMEELAEGELPFLIDITYLDDSTFYMEIINGEERIRLDDIHWGIDRRTAHDTLLIEFPVYESFLKVTYQDRVLEGYWVDKSRDNTAIPFVAKQGVQHRFTELKKTPVMDVSGRWSVTMGLTDDEDGPYPAIGEFKQNGNHLSGTFLTETGDYRYLEGTIQGDKLYLSCFDGSHAFLFEAKILPDSTLTGTFRSGVHYRTTWEGKWDPDARLTPADSLTYLRNADQVFGFTFENADGKLVSLEDEAYKDKIKLVQIMGTWCPNCRDETLFLKEFLQENKEQDLAVIALAFEKHRDKRGAQAAIRKYATRQNLPYEILLAGYHDIKEASQILPMLNRISSYPTLLFLDRNNRVRRIHTGFSGPATSEYAAFKKDFNNFVLSLIQENK